MKIMNKIHCPRCGSALPESVIKQVLSEHLKKAGSTKTAKKAASSARNAMKALEAQKIKYTPEKRREAAKKAWEKRRSKSNQ